MLSRRWTALAAGLLLTTVAVSGCTATAAAHPSPSPTVDLHSPLRPVVPSKLTAASAETETVRLADAIDAIIDPSEIVHIDDHSQQVAATSTAGAYYGVLRTITLDPSIDPVALAKGMVKKLGAAGWVSRQNSDADGTYLNALSSDTDAAKAWFVLVGGDSSVAGQSVVTVQLASPDLP